MGGEFQAGLAYGVFHTSHVGRFFVFSLSTVDLSLQNLGFIPVGVRVPWFVCDTCVS
jgi:hypothetical protein